MNVITPTHPNDFQRPLTEAELDRINAERDERLRVALARRRVYAEEIVPQLPRESMQPAGAWPLWCSAAVTVGWVLLAWFTFWR